MPPCPKRPSLALKLSSKGLQYEPDDYYAIDGCQAHAPRPAEWPGDPADFLWRCAWVSNLADEIAPYVPHLTTANRRAWALYLADQWLTGEPASAARPLLFIDAVLGAHQITQRPRSIDL